jgi:hypothetical protein
MTTALKPTMLCLSFLKEHASLSNCQRRVEHCGRAYDCASSERGAAAPQPRVRAASGTRRASGKQGAGAARSSGDRAGVAVHGGASAADELRATTHDREMA